MQVPKKIKQPEVPRLSTKMGVRMEVSIIMKKMLRLARPTALLTQVSPEWMNAIGPRDS